MLRRVRSAWSLLRREGPRALARRIRDRVRGDRKIDEAHLAFEIVRGRRGMLVDVGAHHGGSLAPFADAGWRVLAFEPDESNRAALVARFGDDANVTIDPRGVSDKAARGVAFYRSELSTGISGLSAFHASHTQSGTIDVTTLAAALAERGISRVDVLKIDTEGHDLFVLRGLPWEEVAPRVIVCEFEDAKTLPLGYSFDDLARYLTERGYRVVVSEWFPIERYGTTHRWRRFVTYPCELADRTGWGNLIATRTDADHRALDVLCARITRY